MHFKKLDQPLPENIKLTVAAVRELVSRQGPHILAPKEL